jgi:predicted RNA-binding protein YlxR (DUF448 family)
MISATRKKKPFDGETALDFLTETSDLGGVSGDAATACLPIRTCIAERTRKPDSDLIRFVLSPSGEVVPDLKRNLPGRGVWVTPERWAIEAAVKRRAFERAFRKPVKVSADLPDEIGRLLRKAAVERLSLANKAGLVVAGFTKVEKAIEAGQIITLLHATEAAADGVAKLERRFATAVEGKNYIRPEICLARAEMSLAAGRANVIHAGLKEGGAARAFLRAIGRYSRYQGQPPQAPEPVQDKE